MRKLILFIAVIFLSGSMLLGCTAENDSGSLNSESKETDIPQSSGGIETDLPQESDAEKTDQEIAYAILDEYDFEKGVPELSIEFENLTIRAGRGTYTWMIEYGIYGKDVHGDSFSSHELVDYQEQPINIEEYTELLLVFSRIPTSYEVKIWNADDSDLSQVIDAFGGRIGTAKDQPRTIYTVTAKFKFIDGDFKESGTVHYAFVVN